MSLVRVLIFSCIALLAGPPALRAETVRVAVASNFAPVLEELAVLFKQQSEHELVLISGATGNHYAQIRNGAPFDVFLAGDDARPRMLEEEGKAVADSRFTYALGRLVLWSGDARFVDAEGAVLKQGKFEHLAIANPALAPYGVAAQETLTALGVWEALRGKIVQGDNIAQTLQFVQTGNAQLGFIAQSQLVELNGAGSHWQVPAELYSPIVQQGVILQDSAAARAFVAYLQGEEGRKVIRAAGYELTE